MVNGRPRDLIWQPRCERPTHTKGQTMLERMLEALQQLAPFRRIGQIGRATRSAVALIRVLVVRLLRATRNAVGNLNRLDASPKTRTLLFGRLDRHGPRRTLSAGTIQGFATSGTARIVRQALLQTSRVILVLTSLDFHRRLAANLFETNGALVVMIRHGIKQVGRNGNVQ